jgi:hypothetical protein
VVAQYVARGRRSSCATGAAMGKSALGLRSLTSPLLSSSLSTSVQHHCSAMASRIPFILLLCTGLALRQTLAQQQCYFGPGAENRGPSNLVPCQSSGESACCLLGDTCLSGNTCYNEATGDLYQYGCTDISYQDQSCPYKCGWNASMHSNFDASV